MEKLGHFIWKTNVALSIAMNSPKLGDAQILHF